MAFCRVYKRMDFTFRPGAAFRLFRVEIFSKQISQKSEFESQPCIGLVRLAASLSSLLSVDQQVGAVLTVTDLPWSRRFASQNNRRGIRRTNPYRLPGAESDRNWNRLARDGPCDTSTTAPSPSSPRHPTLTLNQSYCKLNKKNP